MDFLSSPVNRLLLGAVAAIILLCLLIARIRYVRTRGGDRRVGKLLDRLDKEKYRVFHNIFIASEGKYAHINHLIVCSKGLIAVETYNLRGLITGTEGSVKWTQRLRGREVHFMNPIHQYLSDQKPLEDALSDINPKFYLIIVFTDTANLDVQTKTPVLYASQLFVHIDSLNDCDTFDSAQAQDIARRVMSLNLQSERKRRAHIKNIKKELR